MYIFEEGDKERGQLGLGDRRNIQQFEALPINLAEGYQIETVECSGYYSIVTAKNAQGEQKLYGCGRNVDGQLGMGGRRNIEQFEALPINLAEGYQIETVECGGSRTIVMATNSQGEQKLYGCGSNASGQLGLANRSYYKFEELPCREHILKSLVEEERQKECSYNP